MDGLSEADSTLAAVAYSEQIQDPVAWLDYSSASGTVSLSTKSESVRTWSDSLQFIRDVGRKIREEQSGYKRALSAALENELHALLRMRGLKRVLLRPI